MELVITGVVALLAGGGIGYFLGSRGSAIDPDEVTKDHAEWWQLRESLTGTQLQILQFMESNREANIESLQEKFSFIPDRELFYRIEQIVLMGFIRSERKEGVMTYFVNRDYSTTVEDDKTVMIKE